VAVRERQSCGSCAGIETACNSSRADAVCGLSQNLIAGVTAEPVIDAIEAIHIEIERPKGLVRRQRGCFSVIDASAHTMMRWGLRASA